MPSDAYMELETRDLIGETFDQKFGMDDPLARREGAFEIFSFDFAVLSNRPDKDDDPKSAAKPGDGKPSSETNPPPTTGKDHPTVREFTIKKSIDKASSRLFLLC